LSSIAGIINLTIPAPYLFTREVLGWGAGIKKMKKNCEVCGKEFVTSLYKIKRGQGKYCSLKCWGITRNGKPSWNKGKKLHYSVWNKGKGGYKLSPQSEEKKEKIREIMNRPEMREKIAAQLRNENNPLWRGNDVGYSGLHSWLKRKLGKPMICEHCGKKVERPTQIHWANKYHTYKRNLTDWIRLCSSCHKKYDLMNGLKRPEHYKAS
jgi:hypothetical protein